MATSYTQLGCPLPVAVHESTLYMECRCLGELELPRTVYKVNDRVLARTAENSYFSGVVKTMKNGQVLVLFDNGDKVTHSVADISTVITDKLQIT